MTITTRDEVDRAIRERLTADPAFREALLADPRAVLGQIVGVEIPEVVTVTVHEETLTDVHLVIPVPTDQITEDDLELVSGGFVDWNCACV